MSLVPLEKKAKAVVSQQKHHHGHRQYARPKPTTVVSSMQRRLSVGKSSSRLTSSVDGQSRVDGQNAKGSSSSDGHHPTWTWEMTNGNDQCVIIKEVGGSDKEECIVTVTQFDEYPPLKGNLWSWGTPKNDDESSSRQATKNALDTLRQLSQNSSRRYIGMAQIVVAEQKNSSSGLTKESVEGSSSTPPSSGDSAAATGIMSGDCCCPLGQLCVDMIRMMGKQLGVRVLLFHDPSVSFTCFLQNRTTDRCWNIGTIYPTGLQHDRYGVFHPSRREHFITNQEWKRKYVKEHREYCLTGISHLLDKNIHSTVALSLLGNDKKQLTFQKMTTAFPSVSGVDYFNWMLLQKSSRQKPNQQASPDPCIICSPSPDFFDKKRSERFFQIEGGVCLTSSMGTASPGTAQSKLLGMAFAFPYDRTTALELKTRLSLSVPPKLGKSRKEKLLRGYCLAIVCNSSNNNADVAIIYDLLVQKIMIMLRAIHARSLLIFVWKDERLEAIQSVLTSLGFEKILSVDDNKKDPAVCFVRMVQSSKYLITESLVRKD